ncbi:MAG: winged helix-turn-helix transcriptional regulator [Thermoplasmata archaeon]
MCRESDCEEEEECLCPIRGIIDVVSKKWTICIVSLLEEKNPIRYNEIKSKLEEISPKALSDNLKVLEKEGLVERKVHPETPPRVEYSLTEDGKELKMALMPLVRWVQNKKKNKR